jgi:hypothetical protein
MYTMLKEMLVPISDLQHMTLECSVCATAVVLDMMKEATSTQDITPKAGLTPAQCPFCRAPYDVG